jgi:hypothetical protein
MAQNVDVTPFPWLKPGECLSLVQGYSRRTLVVAREFREASIDVCDDRLPETGRWIDERGRLFRRFELPCADWAPDSPTLEPIVTLSSEGLSTLQFPVSQAEALPRPGRLLRADEENQDPSELLSPEVHSIATVLEGVTDNHVEFVNDLWDSVKTHRHYGEENVQGLALRSLHRARARWRRSAKRDEARLALIVKLAARLSRTLEQVCQQPRVVLRRVRKMIGVSRVQETDASCLRWLARQPGRTVVEKAGSRQQVMGIVRVEDADTAENRVVRDLLLRALSECRRYLAENRQFPHHPRVVIVRQFRSLMQKLMRESPVGQVGTLVGEAKPNYVLQHEPRYALLWKNYLLLVRQQKLQEDIWRWRERTWTEVCQLAVWDALRRLGLKGSAWRSDLLISDQQTSGKFLNEHSAVAGWDDCLKAFPGIRSLQIEMVSGVQISRHPAIPPAVRELSPDLALVPQGDEESPLLLVWTLFGNLTASANENFALSLLDSKLQKLASKRPVRALLLIPEIDADSPKPPWQFKLLEVVRLVLPAPAACTMLADTLQRQWRTV